MIEPHFEQISCARVARDMTPKFAVGLVRAHDHRQRVPTHQRCKTLFECKIARECGLLIGRNRIEVGRAVHRSPPDDWVACRVCQHVHQFADALRAGHAKHGREGVVPFGALLGVTINTRWVQACVAH